MIKKKKGKKMSTVINLHTIAETIKRYVFCRVLNTNIQKYTNQNKKYNNQK